MSLDPQEHSQQPAGSQIPVAASQQDPDQIPEDDEDSEAFFDADGEEYSEEGSEDMENRSEKGRLNRTPRHSFTRTRPSSFSSPGLPSSSTRSPPGGQHPSHGVHSPSPSHPHHHQEQQQQRQQLVSLLFLTNSTTSSRYEGVNTELRVKLAALHFTARRPTVACLMTLGGDMATIYAASPLAQIEVRLALLPNSNNNVQMQDIWVFSRTS